VGGGNDSGLSALPAVHDLAARLDVPHAVAVQAARRVIDARREELRAGGTNGAEPDLVARAREEAAALERPSLQRVLNATGVIVHTNLGRAPLAPAAREAVARAAEGYSNLELDLAAGTRGSRHDHVEALLCELTGAESAMAVNNAAGGVLLATAALAGGGREVVVSRGQLVEIGGGFRVPEVVGQSGARLVEVGTTNRTRLADYERVLGPATGTILRVHQSNFRTLGFVEEVEIESLCALAAPVIDDVGSGALAAGVTALAEEPPVRRSVAAGAALVCFSGDKLLGGPQAGVLVGTGEAVAAARSHPLARALRIDKLSLAALEATLRLYRDPERARREIPVLAMLEAGEGELDARAERLAAAFAHARAEVIRAAAKVGGGALPLLELEGPVVSLDPALAEPLRRGDPPVLGRITEGRLLLDPRTLTDDEVDLVVAAAARARA
jgi:L-seryl-tRNA(Ser) seleniumtransferase